MSKCMIQWRIIIGCFMALTTARPVLAQKQRAMHESKNAELKWATTLFEKAREATHGGRYDEAMLLAEQALEVRERLLISEHPDVVRTLNLLGVLHYKQGDYDEAELLYRRALAIQDKVRSAQHPHVAACLNNLALVYVARGEYSKAEPLHRRALAIWEKVLGKDHPTVATSLNSLATLHWKRGEYDKAEPLYRRALAIRERVLGRDHPDVAASLDSLAYLQRERGEYDKAEPLHRRALAIREKVLGKDHPNVAASLDSLAILHQKRGDYDKAEPLHRRALAIWEKVLGKDHPTVATSLGNLATLHLDRGEYAKAERLYRRALMIQDRALGKDHPNVAASLGNLASLHYEKGEYDKSELLDRRALSIVEKRLGKNHPTVALALGNLAELYSAKRDKNAALRFYELALQAWTYNLRLELRSGSEHQKQKRLARLDNTTTALSFHLVIAPDSARAAVLAMNTILIYKGRVLDAMTDTMRAARERLDDNGRVKLNHLQHLRSELAHLFHQGSGADKAALERYRRRRIALERELDALDADIARRNPAYRALARDVRVADIQAALPQGAALLELFIFRPYTFHAPGVKESARFGEPHYAAYVVHRDGPVRGVDLGPVARINATAQAFQESIAGYRADYVRRARELDALIMEPVRPLLGNAHKLYIAPDGQLSLVSFAALINEQGHYLLERYSLTYLASGRDLVQTLPSVAPQSAPLIIADPRYDLGRSPMATAAAAIMSTYDATRRSSSQPCQPIGRLQGTLAEGNALRTMLVHATLWTQEKATETALSSIHGPRILHIATHAFFLPDQDIARDTEAMVGFSALSQPRIAVENGLLRSGLYLAGASRCRGSTDKNGARDDGVLTALEASSLDLRGTRLVVLSACETGLGDIKMGQGIYGLRRAFSVAGAETLVMSLWRVSDAGTEYLMRRYYEHLLRGQGRSEAMRAVQLDLIAQGGQRAHPFYWASFIVSGDDSTLDGEPPPRLPTQPTRAGCAGCASSNAGGQGWSLGLILVLWLLVGGARRHTTRAGLRPESR